MCKLYFIALSFFFVMKSAGQTAISKFSNPAGNYSTSTSGLCIGCSITNPSYVADNTLANSANIFMTAGVAATYGIRAKLNALVPGGTMAGFYLNAGIAVSALPRVTVKTYKGGSLRETIINNGSLLSLLTGGTGFLCGLTNTSLDYDEVGISFTSSLASVLLNADIYYAFGGYSTCPIVSLPVKLEEINYTSVNSINKISWRVEDDGNASYTIQSSADGINFITIGLVVSDNLAGHKDLSFSDNKIYTTDVYYRLAVSEHNAPANTTFFSKIIHVPARSAMQSAALLVFPNPVQGNTATLTISNAKAKQLAITIYNVQGQKLYEQKVQATNGSSNYNLPVSNLAAGNYKLVVDDGNEKLMKQFIKN